MTITQQ